MRSQYSFTCLHSPNDIVYFINDNKVVTGRVISIRLDGIASNKEGESEKNIEYRVEILGSPVPIPVNEKRVFDNKEDLLQSL